MFPAELEPSFKTKDDAISNSQSSNWSHNCVSSKSVWVFFITLPSITYSMVDAIEYIINKVYYKIKSTHYDTNNILNLVPSICCQNWIHISKKIKNETVPWFEHGISCLQDRRFNQLSHAALVGHNGLITLFPKQNKYVRRVQISEQTPI